MIKKLVRWWKRKTMPRLEACPFCGRSNQEPGGNDIRIVRDDIDAEWIVYCDECGARGPFAWNKNMAVYRWNKRRVE